MSARRRKQIDEQQLLDDQADAEAFRAVQALLLKADRAKEDFARLKREVKQAERRWKDADLEYRSLLRRERGKRGC